MQISVDDLQDLIKRGQRLTILDVRPQDERREWYVPNSIHVDVYEALKAGRQPKALRQLDLPQDTPIVTVCGAGKTSLLAAEQLRERGLEAYSLAGGMRAWSLAWNRAEVALPDTPTRVIQVRRTGKGCLSYLVGAGEEAAVIDPSLQPQIYLDLASEAGWTITTVLETHVHADHLSRAGELTERSSAVLRLPAQERVKQRFTPIKDGQTVDIGTARLKAIHTPGHTDESTSYVLDNQALFTGDTLFLQSVGRPDLEADPRGSRQRAKRLHRSLQKLLTLPGSVLLLPGHTSEPVPFDGEPITASLDEVSERTALLHVGEQEFVDRIVDRIPPTPPNHKRIVRFNETGTLPDEDLTVLEAGANRCAVS